MGGSNDSTVDTPAMMLNDMSRLIDVLSREAPNAVILVSQALMPRPDNTAGQSWDTLWQYNAGLDDLISAKAAAGIRVKLVDISSITFDDLSPVGPDRGVHPTADGYEELANIWFNAIQNIGTLPPTPTPPAEPGTGNPIIAVDDAYRITSASAFYFNTRYLATNDRAPDGGATVIGIDSVSARGYSVSWGSDGTAVYRPTAIGFVDSISYRVRDADGSIDTGTVFITVGTPPTITTNSGNPMSFTFVENTAVGTPIADIDGTRGNQPTSVSDVWTIASGNEDGLFRIDPATGVLSFARSPDYESLSAAGRATQVLTVGMNEGELFDRQQVTVSITDATEGGGNRPPVVSGPVTLASLQENTSRTITSVQLLANASDPDPGTTLTVQGLTASAGTLTPNGAGSWTYTPVTNDESNVTFSYSVSDGAASTPASAVLDLTPSSSLPPPQPGTGNPVTAVDDSYRLSSASTFYFNTRYVVMNDRAPDGGAHAIAVATTSAAGFSVAWNSDGTTIYRPTAGWTGVDSIDYAVADVDGSSDIGTVFITVGTPPSGGNQPPAVSGPVTLTPLNENTSRIITPAQLLANSSDPDPGTTLRVQNLAASSGTLTANSDGTWTFTPVTGDETGVTFNYLVSDGSASTPATATLDLVPEPETEPGTITGTSGPDTLNGTPGNDRFEALGGNDQANGGDGNDTFVATTGDGDDTYSGGTGTDIYDLSGITSDVTVALSSNRASGSQIGTDALSGIEHVIGGAGNDSLTGLGSDDTLEGGLGNDTLNSGSGNDTQRGGEGDDRLDGGSGNDIQFGDAGNDTIDGGSGVDTMTGGAGGDTFVFRHTGAPASTPVTTGDTASTRDVISDFTPGTDKINLAQIDANRADAADSAFVFVGLGTFSSSTTAAQIRYHQETIGGITHTIVEGTIDSTAGIDFQIDLVGAHTLTASDFIL
jgi:Ca2+-binding RTX toxin-like protein